MPSRVIRGEILTSDSLSRVSLEAELLFTRMILVADDWGRLDGRPNVLRAAAFPTRQIVTEKRLEKWLQELLEEGCVARYRVNGRPFLQLTGWETHRGRQRRAKESKFPSPGASGNTASPDILEKSGDPNGCKVYGVGLGDECKVRSGDASTESPPDGGSSRASPRKLSEEIYPSLCTRAKRHGKPWPEKPHPDTLDVIAKRIRKGSDAADLIAAIDGYVALNGVDPRDDFKPLAHLVPATLYGTKFAKYLEAGQAPQAGAAFEDRVKARVQKIREANAAQRGAAQ